MQMNKTRRALVQRGLIASALVPVAGFFVSTAAYGESPALDSSDPTAKALGYVPKSAKPDANCANCSLFQGKAGDAMGPCTIFPGKSVASAGWCSGWVKKAAA
jgi:High potential iron-sulfur protein